MATKHKQQEYLVLDEISHVMQRVGMYAGSKQITTSLEWIYNPETKKMIKQEVQYIPALVKIFSEILDNAIDEHRRAPDILTQIKVIFSENGEITVHDNGRGIPVKIHEKTGKYIAETVFTNMRAGSNFNDAEDQQLIGTNGVGSTLTNILSKSFRVKSCDGKKLFSQEYVNNMRELNEPKITSSSKNSTEITFIPDYAFFGIDGLSKDHILKMTKKVVDAAANNLGVKFLVNEEKIDIKSFGDYVELYTSEYVFDETPDWKIGISESDGFEQISFVNSVETYQGGTHVAYVTDQIVEQLRAFLKKKYKQEVKPADIKNHMRVYISANVNRPAFSSQTKENMVSLPSTYKTAWNVPDVFIKKLIKSPIIQQVLDWLEAKAKMLELAELKKLNKEASKTNPKNVDKFDDAVEKKNRHLCELFVVEGDSARNSIQSARGKNQLIGSFSLRGKPLNVYDAETKDVISNTEFANILTITGLQLGVKVTDINQLRFGKINIMPDADLDGSHIFALNVSFYAKYWPELFELGVIHKMVTPLVIAKDNKTKIETDFFSDEEYDRWAKTAKPHTASRFKGLGGFNTKIFGRFLENREKYLVKVSPLEAKDMAQLELAFSSEEADNRKVWLNEMSYFDNHDV